MAAALLPRRFANAWTRLGLTQSLAELPAGLLDSPELVGSSSLAASGSLPSSSSSSSGAGGGGVLDAAAYAPGSQVRAAGPSVPGTVLGLCLLCTGAVPTSRWPLCVAASVVMPAPLRAFDAALLPVLCPLCRKCGWKERCCGGTTRTARKWCPLCSTLSSWRRSWLICGSR